jgi:hypothetical protein
MDIRVGSGRAPPRPVLVRVILIATGRGNGRCSPSERRKWLEEPPLSDTMVRELEVRLEPVYARREY